MSGHRPARTAGPGLVLAPRSFCCAALSMAAFCFGGTAAAAAGAPAPTAPALSTSPPSLPAAPAAPSPVRGRMALIVQRAGGNPLFAIAPASIVVRGVVDPYVSGQQVKLSVYRGWRKIGVKILPIAPIGNGRGRFHLTVASTRTGAVQVRAVHYGTPSQAQFTAHTGTIHFIYTNMAAGTRGESVRLLQSELGALHYAVSLSGTFDEATARAVIAYRKMAGLARVPWTDTHMFRLLSYGAGAFHVRYRGDGRHVEADLTGQVLAEIEPEGRVRALYEMSSGKPSTPTVIGRFRVYLKTPGENAKGMVDSNYFIAGYAIHGYAEVPTFPASHGCLRVPIPNAASIFGWVGVGMPVDVYYEGGGGSHSVSGHAGP